MRKTLIQARGVSILALLFWVGVAGRALFDLTLARAGAPPLPGALSLTECVRTLTSSPWGKLNQAHQKWLPVRGIGTSWDAMIQPGQMTHWRGRTARLHSIGGADLIGRVTAIQVDPKSDPQSFLRVALFYVQPSNGGAVVSQMASRIARIDVMTTMVPKEAFFQFYGENSRKNTGFAGLLKSQGKHVALYTKSGVFYEQAVIEGRVVAFALSSRSQRESKVVVEVGRGQHVDVALDDIKAYAELKREHSE